jgi:transcriptional regulator with XRE-family HTH domain
MSEREYGYWTRLLRQFRQHNGINQSALAEMLGVDQTTVSRWERGRDIPGLHAQRDIRDLLRREVASRQDMVVRARVRHAVWPATILRRGAIFVECNQGALREIGRFDDDLRGQSIYGHFGPHTDDVTEHWENTGIFNGDIALTISINELMTGPGKSVFVRTMDTPHVTSSGDIWCVCELQRIDEKSYRHLEHEFGGSTLSLSYDTL